MPPAGFEPALPAGERLQTHALDRSATVIGSVKKHTDIEILPRHVSALLCHPREESTPTYTQKTMAVYALSLQLCSICLFYSN